MYVNIANTVNAYELTLQACESQEKCRTAVIDLLDELDIFLSIGEEMQRGPGLEGRRLSKQAMTTMLVLIKNMSSYICETSSSNAFCACHSTHTRSLAYAPCSQIFV